MAFYRLSALIKKDLAWIRGDYKIVLSLLFGPVFFGLVFIIPYIIPEEYLQQEVQKGASLLYQNPKLAYLLLAITVTALMNNIYMTCEMILQEKARGTVLALLSTPLKPLEFILGKIFLSFSFSFPFFLIYLAPAVFSGEMIAPLNPLVILNLALFSGTMCLWGCIPGLFFESAANRQQAVIIPSLLLMGSLMEIIVTGDLEEVSPAFKKWRFLNPLAHTFKSLESAEWRELLIHTGFNVLFFSGFAFFCAYYTKFYFSNSREKRFSLKLFAGLCGLVGLYVLSGWLSPVLL